MSKIKKKKMYTYMIVNNGNSIDLFDLKLIRVLINFLFVWGMCVCVRACVRACERVCVCMCVCVC